MNRTSCQELFRNFRNIKYAHEQLLGIIYTETEDSRTIAFPSDISITFFLLSKHATLNGFTCSEGQFITIHTNKEFQTVVITSTINGCIFWVVNDKVQLQHYNELKQNNATRSTDQLYYWISKIILQLNEKSTIPLQLENNCQFLQSLISIKKPEAIRNCNKFENVFAVVYTITTLDKIPMKSWTVIKTTSTPYITPHEFQRIFKTIYGVPVNEWLTYQKMFLAANLLQHSQQSISNISVTVGFNSDTNFSTSFKRHFHITPALFRKSTNTLNV